MVLNGIFILLLPLVSADASKYIAQVCNAYETQEARIRCFEDNDLDFSGMRAVEKAKKALENPPEQPRSAVCALKDCSPHLYWQAVEAVCPSVLESLAKWDYEWTDGWMGIKFGTQHYNTGNPDVYRFIGSELKLQNGFGAWRRVSYYCDVNFITGNIVDAGVQ